MRQQPAVHLAPARFSASLAGRLIVLAALGLGACTSQSRDTGDEERVDILSTYFAADAPRVLGRDAKAVFAAKGKEFVPVPRFVKEGGEGAFQPPEGFYVRWSSEAREGAQLVVGKVRPFRMRETGLEGTGRIEKGALRFDGEKDVSYWSIQGPGYEEWLTLRLDARRNTKVYDAVGWTLSRKEANAPRFRVTEDGALQIVDDRSGTLVVVRIVHVSRSTKARFSVRSEETAYLELILPQPFPEQEVLVGLSWESSRNEVVRGPPEVARASHTATRLQDGRVLVAGGVGADGVLAAAELLDPSTGFWSKTGSLTEARVEHTATLLPSGKVLVAGGFMDPGGRQPLHSVEIYDPASGRWVSSRPMSAARGDHRAVLLQSGQVLVVGGSGEKGPLASTELYDPRTGGWRTIGPLREARTSCTATLLAGGGVLAAGGIGAKGLLSSAEFFDPATQRWVGVGHMAQARAGHAAALLPNRRVLVAAGKGTEGLLASMEVFDPATSTWSGSGRLATARDRPSLTMIESGEVLVAGGAREKGPSTTGEEYDPDIGAFPSAGSLKTARAAHTATLLPGNRVLLVGGVGPAGPLADAEVYEMFGEGAWRGTGWLATARSFHTATRLRDGRVLVVGGRGKNASASAEQRALASAELYDAARGIWRATGAMAQARYQHTATLLRDGKVLVVGGGLGEHEGSGKAALATAEIYDPKFARWKPAGSLRTPRRGHSAVLLSSGEVLVLGGYDEEGKNVNSLEKYDPQSGRWSSAGQPAPVELSPYSVVSLSSGEVLAIGGKVDRMPSYECSVSRFDPERQAWSSPQDLDVDNCRPPVVAIGESVLFQEGVYQLSAGKIIVKRSDYINERWGTATLLPSGKVLIVGSAENYGWIPPPTLIDPMTDEEVPIDHLFRKRVHHTATLLDGGRVLVVGGEGDRGHTLASAEVYVPAQMKMEAPDSPR